MTRICVTDEQEGQLSRRVDEIKRRVREGTIPFSATMDAVQRIIEANFVFPIWKTITVGTHKSGRTLLATLKREGLHIGVRAEGILSQKVFPVASKRTDVDLVVITGYDLGFTEAAPLRDIIAAGEACGLIRCQPEAAPQLCRKYRDQPEGERLVMVMEPMTDSYGNLYVFHVDRDHDRGERWLSAYRHSLNSLHGPDSWFVFQSHSSA